MITKGCVVRGEGDDLTPSGVEWRELSSEEIERMITPEFRVAVERIREDPDVLNFLRGCSVLSPDKKLRDL